MDLKLFQKYGKYLMLAFDHRGSFKKYVKPANPESATNEEIISVKAMVIKALKDQFSGVLLDPDWGLPAFAAAYAKASTAKKAMAGETSLEEKPKPYILCLEKSGYVESGQDRITELQYTAEQLRRLGADGAKLLIYFNPEAKNSHAQLAVVQTAIADCRVNDLPIFLEIVTYGNEEKNKSRGEWVIRSLEMFLQSNVVPDVWKLEYPTDFSTCRKVTKLTGDVPWILLTRGETFKIFAKQLKDAVAAGAVGFLAGRALWQEIAEHPTDEEKRFFLETTVKERFKIISDIALNKS